MENPVLPSSCVTPAGTSIEVQNEWEENTHTYIHTVQNSNHFILLFRCGCALSLLGAIKIKNDPVALKILLVVNCCNVDSCRGQRSSFINTEVRRIAWLRVLLQGRC